MPKNKRPEPVKRSIQRSRTTRQLRSGVQSSSSVVSKVISEKRSLIAVISSIGHASPLWESASSDAVADDYNRKLAKLRADSIAINIESHLKELLPMRKIEFATTSESASEISIETSSHGSEETLIEAGAKGRSADERDMRRVEVTASLYYATDTIVEDTMSKRKHVSAATNNWEIRTFEILGVSSIAKAAAGGIELKNMLNKQTSVFFAFGGGIDLGVSASVADVSLSPTAFKTPDKMNISDFDLARFLMSGKGSIAFGGGYERSSFEFVSFIGSHRVPPPFSTSGWVAGRLGFSVGSEFLGFIKSADSMNRDRMLFTEKKTRERVERSTMEENQRHRVYFKTGSHKVERQQEALLGSFLATVAEPFRE